MFNIAMYMPESIICHKNTEITTNPDDSLIYKTYF